MNPTIAPPSRPQAAKDPVRVMVVDDSAVIRGLITRTLESGGGISVVASAGDGQRAIEVLKKTDIEVVVLDVEMPRMDGLSALPQLLKVAPNVRIIMASTLTTRNADISLKALQAGAVDYVPKPTTTRGVSAGTEFKRELQGKVVAHAQALRQRGGTKRSSELSKGTDFRISASAGGGVPKGSILAAKAALPVTLRPLMRTKPTILAFGSSTGGPQALFKVMGALKGVKQPVFLTQHMPPTFTKILADHITKNCGIQAVEVQDGMPVQNGIVHLAPGGKHMTVQRSGAQTVIKLDDGPPENFCKPAVDVMLRSLVSVYGSSILTVILTGMGSDGMKSCQLLVEKGGSVIAQDEPSSVVWGMPGAVAQAGVCSAVLPLGDIGKRVRDIADGRTA